MRPALTPGQECRPNGEDPAQPYLFINKDIFNLNRTSAEVFAVGSHVSKGSRKWSKSKSSLALDSSTGKILASSGIQRPPLPHVSSPLPGKPVTMRWRMDSSSGPQISKTDKWQRKLQVVTGPSKVPASTKSSDSGSPEATTTSSEPSTPSSESLISFYLRIIQPFALTVSTKWTWIDDERMIRKSHSLKMAICAFTAAFRTGVEIGTHALALPPLSEDGSPALWPVPEWFQLHTEAISSLRHDFARYKSSNVSFGEAEVYAVLFLMRLQVLLCERDWALLHMQALVEMVENTTDMINLPLELSMWHANLITAYIYKSSIIERHDSNSEENLVVHPLDVDTKGMLSAERQRVSNTCRSRQLLWRSKLPCEVDDNDTALTDDDLLIDVQSAKLNPDTENQLRSCVQMSRYLIAHLTTISYDTGLPKIRNTTEELRAGLCTIMEKEDLLSSRPRLSFWMMFVGALASRGLDHVRSWFLARLSAMRKSLPFEDADEMRLILDPFLDTRSFHNILLQNILDEMHGSSRGSL